MGCTEKIAYGAAHETKRRRIGEQRGERVRESLEVRAILRRDVETGGEGGGGDLDVSSQEAWRIVLERRSRLLGGR
jgi:hypothetical protein